MTRGLMVGLAAAAGLCVQAGGSWAEPHPLTPKDLLGLERLSGPQLSPDERQVAYEVGVPDTAANTLTSRIEVLDIAAKSARPVGGDGRSDSSPRWSADGRSLYFLSAGSGLAQVWVVPATGGAARQVTDLPLDVDTFRLSPDGRRLLVSMEVYPDCPDLACSATRLSKAQASPVKAQVHDRLFIRHWNRWTDGRQSHLFSLALAADGRAEGAAVDLTRDLDADVPSKPRGDDQDYAISPDGRRVAFSARIKGHDEAWSTNFDIFETDIEGHGRPVDLTAANPAWDAEPKYSPDGRWLAWKAMDRPGDEADRFHLVLKDRIGGEVRTLADDWDRSIYHYDFARDSRSVLATTDHLGHHVLWRVDLAAGRPSLVVGEGTVTDLAVGANTLVYGLSSIGAPVDLYRRDAKGVTGQITRINAARLAGVGLGAFEQFHFRGWNDEEVSGFVVKPADYVPGRTYPVAFVVHGGPQLSYGDGWSYRWNPQIFAGAGIAVVLIDFHGSTGYGQKFTDSITGDWGGKPLVDLRLGLAAATRQFPWLDGGRVCAIGSSYSGYMMNWIQGAWSGRFRCIVNQSGVFDTRALYYETDEMWLDEFEFGAPQYLRPEAFEKFNPIQHVAQWRTPMLVGHGAQDFNVPLSQGVEAFTALQRRGIPSRFVMFPDEGHFIAKPGNALMWQDEILAWLHRWLASEADLRQTSVQ